MKLIYVEWKDSAAYHGWHRLDTGGPALIKSIGILAHKDAAIIVLSTSFNPISKHYMDQLTIPRECITKIRRVRVP